ncbi:hypothetical protein CU102_03815 [Phyllobacterium brassicacearum]|uniref:Uncharacterized protein n=1 Tax=Phyllobacterium brassicacearum TaxID=314235 RepID=A0A2P7BUT2_9HYPH|nr:hypothetical protein [Phyllobacterium brassicacearum]PSH70225.1 hypothetical protein CU102_03815 [Phyllobacterium brassicacearum]TDQ33887.1 hypothetical protein DEV91_10490 [Phyllobacterium brassicacearum]
MSAGTANTFMKAAIVAVGALVAIALIGYMALYASLSGGLTGILINLRSAPDPQSPSLIARRDTAKQSMRSSLSELPAAADFLREDSVYEIDQCRKGQNNWKVRDGYAYQCTQGMTAIYGFDGDFRQHAEKLDKTMRRIGWQPPTYGLSVSDMLREYYDRYYGPLKPPPANFPDGYLVSDLPTPSGYMRDRAKLDVRFAERATSTRSASRNAGLMSAYPVLHDTLRNNDYALIVSVWEVYYEH